MTIGKVKVVEGNEWDKMYAKLAAATNDEIQTIWDALNTWLGSDEYAPGIPMDYWVNAVYTEMDRRGMPHIKETKNG
jgi:hypothetical protein